MGRKLTTALAAAGALNTLNALRPLGWGKVAPVITSFAYGVPTSELPLRVLASQAAGAAVLRRSLTPLAGALTAASWGGLIALHQEARQAPEVIDAALREALGDDYRDRSRHPRPAPEKTPGVVATLRAHGRYTSESRDIAYGPAGHRNQLDVWRRSDLPRDARAPVLVQIHGGGWMTGDRTQQAYPLLSLMAEHGWVCVSVSYRLSPRATWPAQLDDVNAALAWVREHIADHGGDPDFVCTTGGSAGGHLCMLAALGPENDVKAAVPYYGPPDWTNRSGYKHDLLGPALAKRIIKQPLNDETRELYSLASPHDQIHEDAPPFLVFQGDRDNLVSTEDVRSFATDLRRVSRQPVAYAELPGAWHAFDILSTLRARAAARAAADFLGVWWAAYDDARA